MVSLPLHSEQPANARRLAELGLAVSLDPGTATPEEITRACRTVLSEPRYQKAAREWRSRILDLPGADAMVHLRRGTAKP
jgi:UDP:flavonoid glycosyltransferase YjiC (YdhE family)